MLRPFKTLIHHKIPIDHKIISVVGTGSPLAARIQGVGERKSGTGSNIDVGNIEKWDQEQTRRVRNNG